MDFHPYDTGLVPQVLSFVQEYQNHIVNRGRLPGSRVVFPGQGACGGRR
mgnify:CR=1 FL=1